MGHHRQQKYGSEILPVHVPTYSEKKNPDSNESGYMKKIDQSQERYFDAGFLAGTFPEEKTIPTAFSISLTIFTSKSPKKWAEVLNDEVLATVMMNRLL